MGRRVENRTHPMSRLQSTHGFVSKGTGDDSQWKDLSAKTLNRVKTGFGKLGKRKIFRKPGRDTGPGNCEKSKCCSKQRTENLEKLGEKVKKKQKEYSPRRRSKGVMNCGGCKGGEHERTHSEGLPTVCQLGEKKMEKARFLEKAEGPKKNSSEQ